MLAKDKDLEERVKEYAREVAQETLDQIKKNQFNQIHVSLCNSIHLYQKHHPSQPRNLPNLTPGRYKPGANKSPLAAAKSHFLGPIVRQEVG